MKKFFAVIALSFLASSSAFASFIAKGASNICTRDLNPWGRASICSCPDESFYDQRIGSCIQDVLVPATVEGVVATELNRTGHIIGYTLTNNENQTYKIVLPVSLRETFESEEFQSQKVRISGEVMESLDGKLNSHGILVLDTYEQVGE